MSLATVSAPPDSKQIDRRIAGMTIVIVELHPSGAMGNQTGIVIIYVLPV
jgi:hypothetical protein